MASCKQFPRTRPFSELNVGEKCLHSLALLCYCALSNADTCVHWGAPRRRGRNTDFGVHTFSQSWLHAPGCVTLGKFLDLSEPHFLVATMATTTIEVKNVLSALIMQASHFEHQRDLSSATQPRYHAAHSTGVAGQLWAAPTAYEASVRRHRPHLIFRAVQ